MLYRRPERVKSPTILRIVPSAGVDVIDSTIPRCCGVGVRVSAPLRRGAAPYADGSLCSLSPSHLIFLTILSGGERFEGGIL